MNSLHELIEHLEAKPYYFAGSYWSSARGVNSPLSVEVDCEFLHEDMAVVVAGTYRLLPGALQHPFQIRLPFGDASPTATSVQLSTPALGTPKGKLFFTSGHMSFLARTESAALSAEISVSNRNVFTLSGVVDVEGRAFSYSLRGTASSERATLSNVVGIRKGG